MTESIIEIKDITLNRGGKVVLDQVSLSIRRGEVLVVIGPSGSGKSSLLRCLNRLETVQRGTINFDGNDINSIPILSLRQQIGMVFQKTAPFDGTVADNIAFGPQLRGEPLSRQELLDLMQHVTLELELADRDAKTLSGGQEQRLAIARALANRPAVLLLDEPTSALDPIATHKIEDVLLHLSKTTDLTLVWVSHSAEQARRVADRVLLLEEGRVVRFDTVETLLDVEHGDPHTLAFARGVNDNGTQE